MSEGRTATSPPTLLEVRDLLGELHYVADGGGDRDGDSAKEAERIVRWLLNEYLRRGVHVCNQSDPEADRVA